MFLKSLNDFLEGKKFLIGDKPCNEDASVFGAVAQTVYTETGTLNQFIMSEMQFYYTLFTLYKKSKFSSVIQDECPNIVAYIENMKVTYWPDWNDCIGKRNSKKKN